MPIPDIKIDYLRKPWIDQRNTLIDTLCAMHGSCYSDMKKYRNMRFRNKLSSK